MNVGMTTLLKFHSIHSGRCRSPIVFSTQTTSLVPRFGIHSVAQIFVSYTKGKGLAVERHRGYIGKKYKHRKTKVM